MWYNILTLNTNQLLLLTTFVVDFFNLTVETVSVFLSVGSFLDIKKSIIDVDIIFFCTLHVRVTTSTTCIL